MGLKELESTIIECMETDYDKYKSFIYTTFSKMMETMQYIRPISERILELILENDDVELLHKYAHYYAFVIHQSYTHYHEYAELWGSTACAKYIKKLITATHICGMIV